MPITLSTVLFSLGDCKSPDVQRWYSKACGASSESGVRLRFRLYSRLRTAAKAETTGMREHLVMPSIRSLEVAWAEGSDIGRFEHFLKLLNVVDDPFNVHETHHL
jgi:hypothetical protein